MSNPLTTAEIYVVRSSMDGFVTKATRGMRSACTYSAEVAAQRQAEKLFGPSLISVQLLSPEHVFTFRFIATADAPQIAFCWANGVIEFADTMPDGALQIATGPARALQEAVTVAARKGHKEGVWLVPGVPEAGQQDQGLEALEQWLRWHGLKHNAHKLNHGVTFYVPQAAQATTQPAAPARRAA